MKIMRRLFAVNFVCIAILLVLIIDIRSSHPESSAAGIWILDEAVCPGTCEAWYQEDVQKLKGRKWVLTNTGYLDPIENAKCTTGVDFSGLKEQDGAAFVKALPIEVNGHGASNDFIPSKLGVSQKKILAGSMFCRDLGRTIIFMPTQNRLCKYLDGGVFAVFKRVQP